MRFRTYCDNCGEVLNEDSNCVIFRHLAYETLVFCDDDCHSKFMKEHTYDAYIDHKGRLIED